MVKVHVTTKADKAKEVEQVFVTSPSILFWKFNVEKKKRKRCWWPRLRIWTTVWWREKQMKNREKWRKDGKQSGKKLPPNSIFQGSTQALNKPKSFMDLVLFKQVSIHGKFHYSLFMEEAVTTVISQRKGNPREKTYKLQIWNKHLHSPFPFNFF